MVESQPSEVLIFPLGLMRQPIFCAVLCKYGHFMGLLTMYGRAHGGL